MKGVCVCWYKACVIFQRQFITSLAKRYFPSRYKWVTISNILYFKVLLLLYWFSLRCLWVCLCQFVIKSRRRPSIWTTVITPLSDIKFEIYTCLWIGTLLIRHAFNKNTVVQLKNKQKLWHLDIKEISYTWMAQFADICKFDSSLRL